MKAGKLRQSGTRAERTSPNLSSNASNEGRAGHDYQQVNATTKATGPSALKHGESTGADESSVLARRARPLRLSYRLSVGVALSLLMVACSSSTNSPLNNPPQTAITDPSTKGANDTPLSTTPASLFKESVDLVDMSGYSVNVSYAIRSLPSNVTIETADSPPQMAQLEADKGSIQIEVRNTTPGRNLSLFGSFRVDAFYESSRPVCTSKVSSLVIEFENPKGAYCHYTIGSTSPYDHSYSVGEMHSTESQSDRLTSQVEESQAKAIEDDLLEGPDTYGIITDFAVKDGTLTCDDPDSLSQVWIAKVAHVAAPRC